MYGLDIAQILGLGGPSPAPEQARDPFADAALQLETTQNAGAPSPAAIPAPFIPEPVAAEPRGLSPSAGMMGMLPHQQPDPLGEFALKSGAFGAPTLGGGQLDPLATLAGVVKPTAPRAPAGQPTGAPVSGDALRAKGIKKGEAADALTKEGLTRTTDAEIAKAEEIRAGTIKNELAAEAEAVKLQAERVKHTEMIQARLQGVSDDIDRISQEKTDSGRWFKNQGTVANLFLGVSMALSGFSTGKVSPIEWAMKQAEMDVDLQVKDRQAALEGKREQRGLIKDQGLAGESLLEFKSKRMIEANERLKTILVAEAGKHDSEAMRGRRDVALAAIDRANSTHMETIAGHVISEATARSAVGAQIYGHNVTKELGYARIAQDERNHQMQLEAASNKLKSEQAKDLRERGIYQRVLITDPKTNTARFENRIVGVVSNEKSVKDAQDLVGNTNTAIDQLKQLKAAGTERHFGGVPIAGRSSEGYRKAEQAYYAVQQTMRDLLSARGTGANLTTNEEAAIRGVIGAGPNSFLSPDYAHLWDSAMNVVARRANRRLGAFGVQTDIFFETEAKQGTIPPQPAVEEERTTAQKILGDPNDVGAFVDYISDRDNLNLPKWKRP